MRGSEKFDADAANALSGVHGEWCTSVLGGRARVRESSWKSPYSRWTAVRRYLLHDPVRDPSGSSRTPAVAFSKVLLLGHSAAPGRLHRG